MVLPSKAMATLPPASRSPMMPDPMTVASSMAVPMNSAPRRWCRVWVAMAFNPCCHAR